MGEGRKTHRCLSRDPGRWRSHQTVGVGGRYGFSESERGTKSQRSFSFPQARVMATIGVTRGLGDHNLKVCSSTLSIKPFLSCFPEVSTPSFLLGGCGWLLSPTSFPHEHHQPLSLSPPPRYECMI